jgi:hypothetical protein
VIQRFGPGYAYYLNALSFVAVIVAVLSIRSLDLPPGANADTPRPKVTWETFAEGVRFIRNTPILGATMLLDFFATFFSSASALLPVYAKDILKVGAQGFGLLSSFPAMGSLVAGMLMSVLPQTKHTGRVLVYAVIAYGLATIGFGFSNTFWMAAFFLAGTGAADTVSTVLRNTIRNLVTPNHLRGRMVATSMIFFMGGPQLGELEAGAVARFYGAPFSVITGGIGCILASGLVVLFGPLLWRYRLPEPDEEPTAATAT